MKHTSFYVRAGVLSIVTLAAAIAAERFDYKVRNDFFAGFTGDREALARAMTASEEAIAENPKYAEAMVWHGAGTYFMAGNAFRQGDQQKGLELYQKAMQEMDEAVKLAPDSIGVRIPRGAALLTATAFQPMDDRVRSEVQRAIEDYQHTYDIQKEYLDRIGEHPLGQLLLGLGDGYSRLGDQEKAKVYFDQIDQKLPDTPFAKRAAAWRANGKLTPQESQCIGCHVSKN